MASNVIVEFTTKGTDKLASELDKTSKKFNELDDSSTKSSKNITNATTKQLSEYSKLQQQLLKLEQQMINTFDPKEIKSVSKEIDGVKTKMASLNVEASKGTSRFTELKTAFGAAFAFGGVVAGVQVLKELSVNAVGLAIDFEQTGIAFETFLGSAEKGKQLVADLFEFSAKTPFEFPEIQQTAKSLLAFGVESNNIIDTLRRLGDISAGVSKPLGEVALVYGQVLAKGRLQGEELLQFQEKGIPLGKELEKITGLYGASLNKAIEKGQIGFPLVQQAIANLTNEGGKFYNLTEKQSQSLGGRLSTLKDNFNAILRGFAETFLVPVLNGFIGIANVLLKLPSFLSQNRNAFIALGVAVAGLNLNSIISTVGLLINSFRAYVVSTFAGVSVTELFRGALNRLKIAIATNPLGIFLAVVSSIAAAFLLAYQNSINFRASIDGVINASKALFTNLGAVGTLLKDLFTGDFKSLKNDFNSLKLVISSAFTEAKNKTLTAKTEQDKYTSSIKKTEDAVVSLSNKTKEAAKTNLERLKDEVSKQSKELENIVLNSDLELSYSDITGKRLNIEQLKEKIKVAEQLINTSLEGKPLEIKPNVKIASPAIGIDFSSIPNPDDIKSQQDQANKNQELLDEQAKREKNIADLKANAFDLARNGAQEVFNITSSIFNAELQQIQTKRNLELSAIDATAKSKTEKEKLKAAAVAKYAKEEAAIKRKQAIADKASAIFKIGLDTAVAITSALKTPALIPYIIGFAAAQLAVAIATPIPKFGKGGKVSGKSHAQGGVMAELEGDEYVLRRDAVRKLGIKNLDLLNSGKVVPFVQNMMLKHAMPNYDNIKKVAGMPAVTVNIDSMKGEMKDLKGEMQWLTRYMSDNRSNTDKANVLLGSINRNLTLQKAS